MPTLRCRHNRDQSLCTVCGKPCPTWTPAQDQREPEYHFKPFVIWARCAKRVTIPTQALRA